MARKCATSFRHPFHDQCPQPRAEHTRPVESEAEPGRIAHPLGHVTRFDGQGTTRWHGITGIHHKIHDDLLDLSWICLHSPKRLASVECERNRSEERRVGKESRSMWWWCEV